MSLTLQFSLVAALLTFVGMFLAFSLVCRAADVLIVLVGLGACGFGVYSVACGDWYDWATVSPGGAQPELWRPCCVCPPFRSARGGARRTTEP